MKVVRTDNYGRDDPWEELIAGPGLTKEEAKIHADQLNGSETDESWFYMVVEDDYVLRKGFEP